MDAHRLREMLEAPRGLEEVDAVALRTAVAADPSLAEEQDRIAAWDAVIGPAMEDVPVPAGLAERLSAAVKSQSLPVEPVAPARRVSRRAVLGGVAGILATAVAIVVMVQMSGSAPPPTVAQLLDQSLDHAKDLDDGAWRNDIAVALRQYPIDPVVLAQPTNWQRQVTALDPTAVVYKLRTGPKRTTLFVMRSATMTGLPASPDMTPQHNTEGVCVGAWQTEGLVFVLVIEGSVHDYRSLLSDPLPIT
jgi:hypothetical protein